MPELGHKNLKQEWLDIEYVDKFTRENLSLIMVANMEIIYWLVRLSSIRGEDGVKRWMQGYWLF